MNKSLIALFVIVPLSCTVHGATDLLATNFEEHCSSCHGENLEGGSRPGTNLMEVDLIHGDSVADLSKSIAHDFSQDDITAWSTKLSPGKIRGLAIYIAERRVDRLHAGLKIGAPVAIPENSRTSEVHNFRVEVVTDQLDSKPFSIQPLPDGRILVSEKMKGLRIVDTDGNVSELVTGTPEVLENTKNNGWGHGWLLDIALHPDYEKNGWIYLHHTQRCADCAAIGKSFNRVVRGRLRDGMWVDEEEIWFPGTEYYSLLPDVGAGGRLAFDNSGYLYISVGMKGKNEFDGMQDLSKPWGKIHRVHDDGRVPKDNPFIANQDAYPTIWTYGHRNPQGLEFNFRTGKLWSTEMGPRGGDELNLLLPGRNYGWPLHSMGLDYDGSPIGNVEKPDTKRDLVEPVVDLTPSPAVSSFIFYEGSQFPHWQGDALVGTLKASELYRIVIDKSGRYVHFERLIEKLARIRDIETGPDGNVYLLLEHADGGQVVRLVPSGK